MTDNAGATSLEKKLLDAIFNPLTQTIYSLAPRLAYPEEIDYSVQHQKYITGCVIVSGVAYICFIRSAMIEVGGKASKF